MSRPSIVFATKHYPCPRESYGAQLRAYHLSKALSEIADLKFWVFPYGQVPQETIQRSRSEYENIRISKSPLPGSKSISKKISEQLNPLCGKIGQWFPSKADQKEFLATVDSSDLVWFHGPVIPNLFGRSLWRNSILDIDDIPSQVWKTRAKESPQLGQRIKAQRQAQLWKQREAQLTKRFSTITVCSEDDRHYLGGTEQIHVIPNGFTAPQNQIARNSKATKRIGFIGKIDYPPNMKGMEWFLDHVWPKILLSEPDTELRIVGKNSEKHFHNHPNVSGLGFVDDVDEEMATWSSSIVPILSGGGTRIKIAEAFSKRCPIVSTKLGAYGYQLTDGKECLLADEVDSFAASCIELIRKPELGQRIAENAYQEFLTRWDWKSITSQVIQVAEAHLKPAYV